MLFWSPADGAHGGGAAHDDKPVEGTFTEATAAEHPVPPGGANDDVVLLARPVRETPLDLMNEESWCATDHFVGTAQPGKTVPDDHTRRRREAWVEASARRILVDRAYQHEIEWLAEMGNDAARAAIAVSHRIETKAG